MFKGLCAIWQANRWKSCVWDPLVNIDFHPSWHFLALESQSRNFTLQPCASFPDAKGYLVCPDATLWQNIDSCRAWGENGMCVRGVSKPVCDAFYHLFVVFLCSLTRLSRWIVFVWKSLFWDFPLHLLWSAVTFSISDPPCNIYSSEVLDIGFDLRLHVHSMYVSLCMVSHISSLQRKDGCARGETQQLLPGVHHINKYTNTLKLSHAEILGADRPRK